MAYQIIKFRRNKNSDTGDSLLLKQQNLDIVLDQVGDRPISIISICGPANLGKSFLMNYILRFLQAKEKSIVDWIDKANPRKPLEGFRWQAHAECNSQSDLITTGVCLWGKPFILEDSRGKEFAVLVMDTQGIYDNFSPLVDDLTIVGLCVLLSSVTILNLLAATTYEALDSLEGLCEYANKVQSACRGNKAFEKLSFLIRDWNAHVNPNYDFGAEGGEMYLWQRLNAYLNGKDEVQKGIRNYFEDLTCFLLPDRGNSAKGANFDGNFSFLSKLFRGKMEEYIEDLIEDDLRPRKIDGHFLTAKGLGTYLNAYVELFNKDREMGGNFSSPGSIFLTMIRSSQEIIFEQSLQKYLRFFRDVEDGPGYLTDSAFENLHKEGERKAINYYRLSTNSFKLTLQKSLELKISKERQLLQANNDERRIKAWSSARIAAVNTFRVQFTERFESHLGTSKHLRKQAGIAKGNAYTEFLNQLCGDEKETEIQELWTPLQNQFDEIVNSFVEEISTEERLLKAAARNDEEQTAYFSCPICFEVPKCKIFQCKNGHVICEICCDGVIQCPQCRVSFVGGGKIRNRAVEEILEKLSIV